MIELIAFALLIPLAILLAVVFANVVELLSRW